jgi:Protein of unknown function (DUF2975)
MPSPLPPSAAVRVAYVLVTGLLVLSLSFGLVILVSMGVGVMRDGNSLLYGDTLRVPMQLSTEGLAPLPPALMVDSWVDTGVAIKDPTVKQMLLQSAADVGPLVVFAGALWLVRGLLQSVTRADPFGPRKVRRLRNLGVLLAAGGVLVEVVNYSLRHALYNALPPFPTVDLGVSGPALPVGALLGALAAFVLAAVFAYGSQLREDVEGTI